MRRLAGGDLSTEIPGVGRSDEIGGMAAAVQVFKDAAAEKGNLEAEAVATRQSAEFRTRPRGSGAHRRR